MENGGQEEEYSQGEIRSRERGARIKLSLPPIALLGILLLIFYAVLLIHGKQATTFFPVVLIMAGVFVAAFGAFYDFGANDYVREVFAMKASFKEEQAEYINKQQFYMTLIYLGICGIYVLSGFLFNFAVFGNFG